MQFKALFAAAAASFVVGQGLAQTVLCEVNKDCPTGDTCALLDLADTVLNGDPIPPAILALVESQAPDLGVCLPTV